MKGVYEWISAANHGIEQGIRSSLYREMRERGHSEKESASVARNVTVDFTKKGEWSSATNLAFAFSNASIQGMAKNIKVLKTKRGRQWAAALASAGFFGAMMNIMAGGDDDDGESLYMKIPEHIRSSHIIIMHPAGDSPIPGGGGYYFKIPIAYGWSSIWATGVHAAEFVSGKSSLSDAGASLSSEFVNSWNPVGSAPNLSQFFTPTLLDPFIQHATNTNWAGSPIMPDNDRYGLQLPDSQRYFKSVSDTAKFVSKWANTLTGGDEVEPGFVDVSPETVEHYFSFLTGSAGTTVNRTAALPGKILSGEGVSFRDVPVLRSLIGDPNEWFVSQKYYSHREAIEKLETRVELYEGKRDLKKVRSLKSENAPLWRMRSSLKATDKRIKDLRKKLRSAPEDQADTYLRKIDRLQRQFNKKLAGL